MSQENYTRTRELRWRVQGFTNVQRRKTERMQPGDRLLLYVREPRGFGMTATITSAAFEEQAVIWKNHRHEETFPYRVRIKPEAVLKEGEYIEALELGPGLEYVRRWIPENWPLAFQEELHLFSRRDFELIEGEMRRILGKLRGRRRPTTRQPRIRPTAPIQESGA